MTKPVDKLSSVLKKSVFQGSTPRKLPGGLGAVKGEASANAAVGTELRREATPTTRHLPFLDEK